MTFGKESLDKILDTALQVVSDSSKIIMRYWHEYENQAEHRIKYSSKEDLSPVTKVDYEVERIIREVVLKNHPRHRIIGEEYPREGREDSPYLWVIDPIDGTKQFVRGLQYFATQVAVLYENEVIVRISSAPAIGETIVAVKNRGTLLNNKKIHVSKVNRIEDSFISYGNIRYFNKNNKLSLLVKLCERSWASRGFGDFWGYHLLASGKIDAMLEAETKIWDIAAVSIIVKEAGGRVTDLKGVPISSNTTSIIATNGLIHEEVLNFFK